MSTGIINEGNDEMFEFGRNFPDNQFITANPSIESINPKSLLKNSLNMLNTRAAETNEDVTTAIQFVLVRIETSNLKP